jgi:esterase/lipase
MAMRSQYVALEECLDDKMSWTTYDKLLENIQAIDQMMAGYPDDFQANIKQFYHFGDAFMAFVATLPWTPVIVQQFDMTDPIVELDNPNIVTFNTYRFFRYEDDAVVWRLSI